MKQLGLILIIFLCCCSPKGPQTHTSYYVGKNKAELIEHKGEPKTIKVFDKSQAFIYKVKEEFYGKNSTESDSIPKKAFVTEHIYYIDTANTIYKYQVWKKKLKK